MPPLGREVRAERRSSLHAYRVSSKPLLSGTVQQLHQEPESTTGAPRQTETSYSLAPPPQRGPSGLLPQ